MYNHEFRPQYLPRLTTIKPTPAADPAYKIFPFFPRPGMYPYMTTLMTESDAFHTYAQTRSADAFAHLVSLHAHWVHAAALRLVRDRHLAEDVTQAVFLLLAQKPHKARARPLAGWLFHVTRHCAAHALRAQARRAKHERRALPMSPPDDPLWNEISPRLDAAVARLREADRQLLLQRFYQNFSHAQIGQGLHISEDTARKRVATAVERLRLLLAATAPAAALALLLSARTTAAAPLALKSAIIAGAPAPAALTLAHGAAHMLLLSKLKSALAFAAAGLLLVGSAWYGLAAFASAPASRPAPAAPPARTAASAPASDLSTPKNAFIAVMAAIRAGDRDALYRCLTADPSRSPTILDGALDYHLARNRLYAAADKRFGPPAAAPLRADLVTIDMVGDLLATTQGDAAAVKIDGDDAQLSVDIPATFLNLLPNDFRTIVAAWSKTPMRFKKSGSEWKFDIDHSMQARLSTGRTDLAPDVERRDHAAILKDLATTTDAITAAIPTGNFPAVRDLSEALAAATDAVLERHRMHIFGLDILPYPSTP